MTRPEEPVVVPIQTIVRATGPSATATAATAYPRLTRASLLAAAFLGWSVAAGCSTGRTDVNCPNCPCSDYVAKGAPGLVDDLNDGNGYILENDGRSSGWYTYNDGTGIQMPAGVPPGPPYVCEPETFTPTNGQACTSGSGFTSWGAGLGVGLLSGADCVSCKYDATAYSGVRFTISGSVVGSVRFTVVTTATHNVRWGGTCADDKVCTDSYGTNVTITTQPQVVEVPWTILRQSGWGTPVLFNIRELNNFNWEVDRNTTAPVVSFDSLCVDDVGFY